MKHISDELLEKYLDKKCGVIRTAAFSAHLRKCGKCKRRLEALAEDRKLLSEIREAVGGQEKIEKMEAEFKGLARLRKLLGEDNCVSKIATGR